MLRSLQSMIDEIDNYCGTGYPRHLPPKPKGVRDLLLSVAIADLASQISQVEVRQELLKMTSNLAARGAQDINRMQPSQMTRGLAMDAAEPRAFDQSEAVASN